METETIKILEKSQIKKEAKKDITSAGCCGGEPASNKEACCQLDEAKKAEGESGCGCNTTTNINSTPKCC